MLKFPFFNHEQLNPTQKRFLLSALAWFIAWQVLDFLLPLDVWLTDLVVSLSRGGIKLFLGKSTLCFRLHTPFEGYLLTDKEATFNIAHSCNGKAILFLFTAFLWSIPGHSVTKKLTFTMAGFILIVLANAIRIVGLFQVLRKTPVWFDFLHHGLFQWAMYGIMLFLWLTFLGKIRLFGRASS